MNKKHSGGCHCGQIKFTVTGKLENILYCNCSVCAKKGYLHWIIPKEQFDLICGKEALSEYTFNTGIAKHLFCKSCGIHSFYVPRSHPDGISVNARCLEGVDPTKLNVKLFDGQHWEERIDEIHR